MLKRTKREKLNELSILFMKDSSMAETRRQLKKGILKKPGLLSLEWSKQKNLGYLKLPGSHLQMTMQKGLHMPHDGALIVKLFVTNCGVNMVMIKNGILVDTIFLLTLQRMK